MGAAGDGRAVGSAARSIVVGYDGSDAARRALEHAADLAGYGSSVTVVSVAAERDDRLLGEARDLLGRRRLVARYVAPTGEAAEALIGEAHQLDADLIVVGKRNHNALDRLGLGSVSARVVREAQCDVLVVA